MSGAAYKARGTSYPSVRRQQRTLNKPQHHKSHTTTLQQQRIVAKPYYNVTATTHRCQIPPHCYSNSKSLRYFYHKTQQTKSHHGLASVRSRQLSSHMLERHSINTREERPSCRIMALPSVLRPTPQGNTSCFKATNYASGHQYTLRPRASIPSMPQGINPKTPTTNTPTNAADTQGYNRNSSNLLCSHKQTNNQTLKHKHKHKGRGQKQTTTHNYSSPISPSSTAGAKTPASSRATGERSTKPSTQGTAANTPWW